MWFDYHKAPVLSEWSALQGFQFFLQDSIAGIVALYILEDPGFQFLKYVCGSGQVPRKIADKTFFNQVI